MDGHGIFEDSSGSVGRKKKAFESNRRQKGEDETKVISPDPIIGSVFGDTRRY